MPLASSSVCHYCTKWMIAWGEFFLLIFSVVLFALTALRAAYSVLTLLAFSQCTLSVNHFHFLSHFYSSSLCSVEFRLHPTSKPQICFTSCNNVALFLPRPSEASLLQTELLRQNWAALCFRRSCSLHISHWAALWFRMICFLNQT